VYINGDVEEYPKGSMKLKTTITDGVSGPQALAIDAKNNLYVLNHPPTIAVYAPGSTAPFITFSGGGMILPSALALDKQSNLYIADPFAGAVFEVKAGYFSVQKLDLKGLAQPFGLAFEARTGYLWVTDGNENVINVYDLSRSKSPIKTLPGNGDPNTITASDVGETKVEMAVADLERDEVYVYKRKEHTPYGGISNGIQLTTALLIRKP
jgi:DNA-binding beta-propeller fold protein YncE